MRAAIMLGAALVTAQTALAQAIDPHQPNNNGSAKDSATVPPGGVAPGLDPGTARLNAKTDAAVDARRSAHRAAKARYTQDLAAYDAKLKAQGKAVNAEDKRYQQRRAAYADAMAAWRRQVAACKAGHQAACHKPVPQPSDY
jgi:hypothetical protein